MKGQSGLDRRELPALRVTKSAPAGVGAPLRESGLFECSIRTRASLATEKITRGAKVPRSDIRANETLCALPFARVTGRVLIIHGIPTRKPIHIRPTRDPDRVLLRTVTPTGVVPPLRYYDRRDESAYLLT